MYPWQETLHTKRLILEPMNQSDLMFIFEHFSKAEVNRYLYDAPPVTEMNEAQEIVDWYQNTSEKTHCRWIIKLKEDGQSIGTCGFHLYDPSQHTLDIGYDLSPIYWQKGYMKEAVNAILAFVYEKMQVNRIQAIVALDNKASQQLLTSVGFLQEGLLRAKHFYKGVYYDHYVYGILKEDFQS